MKCTSKKFIALLMASALVLTGCGAPIAIDNPYDISTSATNYKYVKNMESEEVLSYFAQDLCVGKDIHTASDLVSDSVVEACGVFNLETGEVNYSKNIYAKLHPASTTKIMTAYVAIKHGVLNDWVTISEHACDQPSDSSIAGLNPGDQMTLEHLLYGLMLRSGNDAAVAIAEHVSGSVENFAKLVNEELAELGATKSHYTNPHGLTDEEHYTCLYDLYLMFDAAMESEVFRKIITTSNYEGTYTDKNGTEMVHNWTNTNKYLTGEVDSPRGITVVGGKTGTTHAAGYCLVLGSVNDKGEDLVSIVLKADGRSNLYYVMNQMLAHFGE